LYPLKAKRRLTNLKPPLALQYKLPGVMAQSALLWIDLRIRITGKWWCDKRIEVLA
jgi:hypothetical protein